MRHRVTKGSWTRPSPSSGSGTTLLPSGVILPSRSRLTQVIKLWGTPAHQSVCIPLGERTLKSAGLEERTTWFRQDPFCFGSSSYKWRNERFVYICSPCQYSSVVSIETNRQTIIHHTRPYNWYATTTVPVFGIYPYFFRVCVYHNNIIHIPITRVTIFGESAGAASVHWQMLAPSAAGICTGCLWSTPTTLGKNILIKIYTHFIIYRNA